MSAIRREYPTWKALLAKLGSVESAPASAAKLNAELTTIAASLSFERDQLAELDRKTTKEREDFDAAQRSPTKRVWTRIRHPTHARRQSVEEDRGYLEAVDREQRCRSRIRELEAQHAEVAGRLTALKPDIEMYKNVQRDLEALYARVFRDGVPEVKRAEERVRACERRKEEAEKALAEQTHLKDLMADAHEALSMAIIHMESARTLATMDQEMENGLTVNMERNEITTAQMFLSRAETLSEEALTLHPELAILPGIQLPLRNFLVDIFLDETRGGNGAANGHATNGNAAAGAAAGARRNSTSNPSLEAKIQQALETLHGSDSVFMRHLVPRVNQGFGDATVEQHNAVAELEKRRVALERVRRRKMEEEGQGCEITEMGTPSIEQPQPLLTPVSELQSIAIY